MSSSLNYSFFGRYLQIDRGIILLSILFSIIGIIQAVSAGGDILSTVSDGSIKSSP